ncbi:MAG TPA: hypothetical protein VG815_03470 [Chloroflexota bacterium]|jgi:hypothetical protein|nr:hypothetical protein [Chloroflexota bacterium]
MVGRKPWIVLALVVAVASSVFGTIVPAGATARPAASPVVALLKRAALATAAMKSAHTQGSAQLAVSVANKGIKFSVAYGATFRGDFSDRGGQARAHLRGQVRYGGRGLYFKLVDSGRRLAGKVGKQKWQCTTVPVSQPKPSTVNPAEIRAVRRFLKMLEEKVRLANLGGTVVRGTPVWDVQASLVTRLDLSSLVASVQGVPKQAKLPKPWVHLKVNLWISQADYAVRRFVIAGRVRIRTETFSIRLNDWLSHYGEHVPIKLPPACTVASPSNPYPGGH